MAPRVSSEPRAALNQERCRCIGLRLSGADQLYSRKGPRLSGRERPLRRRCEGEQAIATAGAAIVLRVVAPVDQGAASAGGRSRSRRKPHIRKAIAAPRYETPLGFRF